jgi:hypothetical protein
MCAENWTNTVSTIYFFFFFENLVQIIFLFQTPHEVVIATYGHLINNEYPYSKGSSNTICGIQNEFTDVINTNSLNQINTSRFAWGILFCDLIFLIGLDWHSCSLTKI